MRTIPKLTSNWLAATNWLPPQQSASTVATFLHYYMTVNFVFIFVQVVTNEAWSPSLPLLPVVRSLVLFIFSKRPMNQV